ncbi:MAG: alpha/beta hydrolase domain-containing protein [Dehalococcoidia bacterium]
MAVTGAEIRQRGPYEGGQAFGDTGAYERIDGVLHFTVDPAHAANRAIVDLNKAARDGDGRVVFEADFCVLQPADPARSNRRLLFEVPNRGGRGALRTFNRAAPSLTPTERIDPGDGFLLRRGWSVAWCGWQWDVFRSAVLMGIEAPQALGADGHPIAGLMMLRYQPNAFSRSIPLTDRHVGTVGNHKPYPVADCDQPDATLTVRDHAGAERSEIPRNRWRFARDEGGSPAVDDSSLWLEDGFEPGRIYELVYRTRICPVAGAGLLAVRDGVSFLRNGSEAAGNPCAGRIDHTYGEGQSQCGRFLRHFLYLGLNQDERGGQVFDGVLAHIAGGRRGEFNHRYAQPSVQPTPGFGHLFPFADDKQTDPLSGVSDGLLRRQRVGGGVPRIMYTNTSAEYWRGDAALVHTDLATGGDAEPPEEVRVYHFAGTQHGAGVLPLTDASPFGTRGANAFNAVDYRTLLRAALINLDAWVSAGEPPPPSSFPRRANGSASSPEQVIAALSGVPATALPAPERLRRMRTLDLGPDASHGVGAYPPAAGDAYPFAVSAVDADGNELAGIRLPDVSVPVAAYSGWNPRHPETGGAGQLLDYLGSTVPFPATREQRARTGNPRRSIAERYRDRDDYVAQARTAAKHLAEQRYLLAEDVELAVQLAVQRYDAFAATPAAVV